VNGQIPGRFSIDFLDACQPFLMSVPLGDGGNALALQVVECEEQGQGTAANVIVCGGLDMADTQR